MRAAWLVLAIAATACGEGEDPACHVPDGRVLEPGDDFPAGDGCNRCHCFPEDSAYEPGHWSCTLVGCTSPMPKLCEPISGSTCTLGPPCGDGCCGQGERCVAGSCACGDGAACTDGDICGSPDPVEGDGCGVTCCAPGSSCG